MAEEGRIGGGSGGERDRGLCVCWGGATGVSSSNHRSRWSDNDDIIICPTTTATTTTVGCNRCRNDRATASATDNAVPKTHKHCDPATPSSPRSFPPPSSLPCMGICLFLASSFCIVTFKAEDILRLQVTERKIIGEGEGESGVRPCGYSKTFDQWWRPEKN